MGYISIIKDLLLPNIVVETVEDIPFEKLYSKGYRIVFLDVDNTLVSYSNRKVSLQRQQWLRSVKSLGFTVYLISNNIRYSRILTIAKQLDVEGIFFAFKPFPMSVMQLIHEKGIDTEQLIVCGDQLMTDIILGKWVRAYSILVDPVDKSVSFIKTLQRELELFVLGKLSK